MRHLQTMILISFVVLIVAIVAPMTNIDRGQLKVATQYAYAYALNDSVLLKPYDSLFERKALNVYVSNTERGAFKIDNKDNVSTKEFTKLPEEVLNNVVVAISSDKEVPLYAAPSREYLLFAKAKPMENGELAYASTFNEDYLQLVTKAGHKFFVNINDVDLVVSNAKNLKIIGSGSNQMVVSNERNLTTVLTERTNLTVSELRKITAGTGLEGIESAIITVEEKYGINALFTLAVAVEESGWGNSHFARTRNNLFGICAYDSNLDATKRFSSKAECVEYFGELIYDWYFAEGRRDLYSINRKYASSPQWAPNIQSIMNGFVAELR